MTKSEKNDILLSPSVMLVDLLNAKEELQFLNENAHFIHIDIKDGSYVRTFGTTPTFIEQIRPIITKPIDAHLMINNPWIHLDELARVGADFITVHADVIEKEAFRILNKIKSLGCKVGIAVNPATPIMNIVPYLNLIHKVTIMTVDPGYAGQSFVYHTLEKIQELNNIREQRNMDFLIEADGSIDEKVYQDLVRSGTDVIVLGGPALFDKSDSIQKSWEIMNSHLNEVAKAQ